MSTYIEDGYTRTDGYIGAAPEAKSGERLWDAVEFEYRAATRQEVIRHDEEVRHALKDQDNDPECAVKAERLACEFVAKRIQRWSVENSKGGIVPVTSDTAGRIQTQLFWRIYQIIRGTGVSDPKPDGSDASDGSSVLSDESQIKN